MTVHASILGVGTVGPLRHDQIDVDYVALAGDALVMAAADAGLPREAIDGLVINSGGAAGPDYDQLANYLGLDIRTSLQSWAHGRFTSSVINQAALLVADGMADVVACLYARRLQSDVVGGPGWKGWSEELRKGGGPHGERPSIGLTAPLGMAALAARLYANRYDVDLHDMYHVVSQLRRNARAYPGAMRTSEVTEEQYDQNPFVVEPLRRWDCTPRTEGAVCVLVGNASAAASPDRSVAILGADGIPAGPGEFIWSRPGLGFSDQPWDPEPAPDEDIFRRAGVDRTDVDVFLTYDPFTPLVWFGLERFGYCQPGTAPAFVRETGLGFDGGQPTNTHGGSLAAGQLAGWLHIAEAVIQVRGEAGDRQVPDAAVAHYGACYGDSLVLGAAR